MKMQAGLESAVCEHRSASVSARISMHGLARSEHLHTHTPIHPYTPTPMHPCSWALTARLLSKKCLSRPHLNPHTHTRALQQSQAMPEHLNIIVAPTHTHLHTHEHTKCYGV